MNSNIRAGTEPNSDKGHEYRGQQALRRLGDGNYRGLIQACHTHTYGQIKVRQIIFSR